MTVYFEHGDSVWKACILSPHRCTPSGVPLFAGMVVPLAIFSIIEVILFAVVTLLMVVNKLPRKEIMSKVIRSMLLAVLFVTGWGIALGKANAEGTVAVALEATFMVFGAPLGLYIFVLYLLSSRTARMVWKVWCYRVTCREYHHKDIDKQTSTMLRKNSKKLSISYKPKKPELDLHPLQYTMPDLKSPSPASPVHTADTLNTDSNVDQEDVTHSTGSSTSKSAEESVDMPVADMSQSEVSKLPYIHPNLSSSDIDPPDPNEETAL